MNKKLLVAILISGLEFILVLGVGIAWQSGPVALAGTLIYVRPDGSDILCNGSASNPVSLQPNCAFKTIQKGIEEVDAGGVVYVAEGLYQEQVIINKPLTLRGDPGDLQTPGPGPTAPTIDGSAFVGQMDGVTIAPTVDNVTVEGFIIQNFASSSPGYGVGVKGYNQSTSSSDNVIVRDNQIDNCAWAGVMAVNEGQSVYRNWLVNSNVVNMGPWSPDQNVYGIELSNTRNSTITHNIVSGGYAGILLTTQVPDGLNLTAENNLVQANVISNSARFNIQLLSYTYGDYSSAATGSDPFDTVQGFDRVMAPYRFGGILQNLETITSSPGRRQNSGQIGPMASGALLRNIDIVGNRLTNTGLASPADNSGRIMIAYNWQGTIENLDIISNFMTIVLTDSTPFSGTAVYMLDIEGSSNFSHNMYQATGSMAPGWFFHGLDISGAGSGDWSVEYNDFQGNLLGSYSAAVRLRPSLPGTTIYVGGNNITGFFSGIRSDVQTSFVTILASFNRLVGNTTAGIYNNGSAPVYGLNNWWGCNAGPGNSGCDDWVGNVETDPWLVLRLFAFPSPIPLTGFSNVRANLTYNSAGGSTAAAGHVPDGIPATYTAVPGSMSPTLTGTSAGIATSVFSPVVEGTAIISATVDNQTVSITIPVQPVSNFFFLPLVFKNGSPS